MKTNFQIFAINLQNIDVGLRLTGKNPTEGGGELHAHQTTEWKNNIIRIIFTGGVNKTLLFTQFNQIIYNV